LHISFSKYSNYSKSYFVVIIFNFVDYFYKMKVSIDKNSVKKWSS